MAKSLKKSLRRRKRKRRSDRVEVSTALISLEINAVYESKTRDPERSLSTLEPTPILKTMSRPRPRPPPINYRQSTAKQEARA
jgi:hypothetical protein